MNDLSAEFASGPLAIKGGPVTCTTTGRQEPTMLPTEIWVIILTIVVDPDRLCYDYCTSFDFPRLNYEWRLLFGSALNITAIDSQISQLRLVCRLWSNLLEPTWKPHLKTETPLSIGAYKGIRTLFIVVKGNPNFDEYKPYPLDKCLAGATRNINTLVIDDSAGSEGLDFTDVLFSYSEYFPNVRSFSFMSFHDLSPDFWARLGRAFPRLTALMLIGLGQEGGTISLPYLEILEINLDITRPPHFYFPSLKHFSSGGGPTYASCAEIIRTCGMGLKSLLFPCYYYDHEGFFGEDFWTQLPKLELLGTPAPALSRLTCPPVGHPFSHLCLYEFDLQSIQTFIDNLHDLRHLSILCQYHSAAAPKAVVQIDRFLTRIGAKQLDTRFYSDSPAFHLERLIKEGPWQKVTRHLSFQAKFFICTWELGSKETGYS